MLLFSRQGLIQIQGHRNETLVGPQNHVPHASVIGSVHKVYPASPGAKFPFVASRDRRRVRFPRRQEQMHRLGYQQVSLNRAIKFVSELIEAEQVELIVAFSVKGDFGAAPYGRALALALRKRPTMPVGK